MAGDVVNIKVCSPLKLHSSLIGKNHAIYHYSYNLPFSSYIKKMNKIQDKQNEPKIINYLKAQRIAYRQCKTYQIFDIISILFAVVLPIIGMLNNDIVNYLGAFGVFWTILYLVTENYRRRKTEQEAKIQDVIYSERTVRENIPDWFFKFSKSSNENRTDSIIKSIKSNF